jgi:hypothetical protein
MIENHEIEQGRGFTRAMPKHLQHFLINRGAGAHARVAGDHPSNFRPGRRGAKKWVDRAPLVFRSRALPRISSRPDFWFCPENILRPEIFRT